MAKKEAMECPVPAGTLVIIGGKENKGEAPQDNGMSPENYVHMEILKSFIGYIKKTDPVVEVITTASSEGDESFDDYKKAFASIDIRQVHHIHHKTREEVLADDLIERVNAADAIFFSGGDQLLLTSLYGGTAFLTRLKERYIHEAVVIGGTSAGAMALSTPMIYAGNKDVQQISGEIKVTTGLEFLKDVCIDTHFVDRGRFVRLAQVIASNPTSIGIGIEEDTAVVVRNGTESEIIGNGTVIVIDGTGIKGSSISTFGQNERISIQNLQVHILSKGDTYNISITNPPHK